jgi:hypothetical protein
MCMRDYNDCFLNNPNADGNIESDKFLHHLLLVNFHRVQSAVGYLGDVNFYEADIWRPLSKTSKLPEEEPQGKN